MVIIKGVPEEIKASAKGVRKKHIKVMLNERDVWYLNELADIEGEWSKSNLIRRLIFERYKERVKAT